MTAKRTYVDSLKDILAALKKVEQFTHDMDYKTFSADEKTVFAVVRSLEIIGEAAKNIPDSLRAKYPDVPWREMSGMRDNLVHEYFRVNLQVVWRTLQRDLPLLRPPISQLVEEIIQEESDTE